jgi:exodeoxyribonuclease-3
MWVLYAKIYHLATPELAAGANMVEIDKDQKFSDHAPVTMGYDLGH